MIRGFRRREKAHIVVATRNDRGNRSRPCSTAGNRTAADDGRARLPVGKVAAEVARGDISRKRRGCAGIKVAVESHANRGRRTTR